MSTRFLLVVKMQKQQQIKKKFNVFFFVKTEKKNWKNYIVFCVNENILITFILVYIKLKKIWKE